MLAALRGERDRIDLLTAEVEQAALPAAARPVLATVQHARGLAALGDGRHLDAYKELRRSFDPAAMTSASSSVLVGAPSGLTLGPAWRRTGLPPGRAG